MTTTDTTENPTATIPDLASDHRVKAFDEWAASEPMLQQLVTDPNTRRLLQRVFLCGAVTQESLDAAAIDAVATQRDFLDSVCARSTDACTVNWRSGFEHGCPPELIWESQSGGVGVEGEEAHRAQGAEAELQLFEVLVDERVCWVVAGSEATAIGLAVQSVHAEVTHLRDDDNALRMLEPLGDSPYAGKSLREAVAEQKATGRPGYIGSRTW